MYKWNAFSWILINTIRLEINCCHFNQDYDAEDLKDFEETILQGVGYDKDGKISRKELTMILLTLAKMPPNEQ